MDAQIYNHMDGVDVVPENMLGEIADIIDEYTPVIERNSVTKIKTDITDALLLRGWSKEFRLDPTSRITVSSYLRGIGLCFQTGNYGRVYADLLKLQTLFTKGKISAGIILVPEKDLALRLGSNMANYEHFREKVEDFVLTNLKCRVYYTYQLEQNSRN